MPAILASILQQLGAAMLGDESWPDQPLHRLEDRLRRLAQHGGKGVVVGEDPAILPAEVHQRHQKRNAEIAEHAPVLVSRPVLVALAVSYTHLTLPTNREG